MPLLAVLVIVGIFLVQHERETFEREARGRVHSAMTAIDAKLSSSISTMQALAVSKNLAAADLREFHKEAQRVLASQPDWRNIGLATPSRIRLLDAINPFGARAPYTAEDTSFELAIKTGRPAIGDVGFNEVVAQSSVRLRVPVIVGAEVRYVLTVALSPAAFQRLLVSQQLPAAWVIGLADRNKRFIARVPEVPVGTPVAKHFGEAIDRAREGWFPGRTLEGADTYQPYVTSATSGWVLGIAIPAELVDAAAWRTFWLTLLGVLLALGVALGLAWVIGRRIAAPIATLATGARGASKGLELAPPLTRRIDEIAHLHDVLRESSLAVREREALLERERTTLRDQAELLDLTHDAIIVRTSAGPITLWSRGAEETFGWSKSEAMGQVSHQLLHTEFPQPLTEIESELDRLGRWEGTLRCTRKDGARIIVASRWALRRGEPGKPGIVLEIESDITPQTTAKEAIARLNDELMAADQRKDNFLATLAHELRNPLAPIVNCVTLLKSPDLPEGERSRAREVIERQVGQMSRLLDDLLDVSRITHGKLELRRSRVALAQIVETAIETCRPLIDRGANQLILELGERPVYLDVDPIRLAQIIANLLTNAVKYSHDGKRIWITAATSGNDITIAIRDEGIGIGADILPRVFEIFIQSDASVNRAQGGLGIGLALVRALTELHGGKVEVRSEGSGKGSEFVVRLNGAVAADTQAPAADDGDRGFDIPPSSFLIADDLADSADSLALLLRQYGHKVHIAYDGEQALETAARFKPRVALLDIGMPKLDGHDVARKIRAQPWGRDMVLIALSGWGQRDDRHRTREAGFTHHLVKPLDLAELAAVLTSAPDVPAGEVAPEENTA